MCTTMNAKYRNVVFVSVLYFLILTWPTMSAQTIGYWRFEGDGWLTDKGPHSLALTNDGGRAEISDASRLGFPEKLPQTRDANKQAVRLAQGASLSGGTRPYFNVSRFTIEMYIRSSNNSAGTLASQWAAYGGPAQRGWRFAVNDNSELQMSLSTDGTRGPRTSRTSKSDLTIEAGKTYYVAAAVNVTDEGTTTTFYLKDVANGGAVQKETVEDPGVDRLHQSTAPFVVGATAKGKGYHKGRRSHFEGVIDEVRWSAGILEEDQLLGIPVPPPPPAARNAIGYWRFEGDDFLEDISPNGLLLSNPNEGEQVSLHSYHWRSPGVSFWNNVPASGQINEHALRLDGKSALSCDPVKEFYADAFTIEALCEADEIGKTMTIASQFSVRPGPAERRWHLSVGKDGRLHMNLSNDGTVGPRTNIKFESNLKMKERTGYFVAASVDVTDEGGKVKFYLKNLQDKSPLKTDVVEKDRPGRLHTSKAPFLIGAVAAEDDLSGTRNNFEGLIDEVRFTGNVLGEKELLLSSDTDRDTSK